jgi:hypothetical protein
MSMIFIRVGSAAVFLSIVSHKAEPRAFDKARLPIIAVDGESVFDLNKEMELNQRANPNLDWCFSEDRSVGAIIWAGDQITPTATIRKFIAGNSVNVRLFFDPFEMGEYNTSLNGFGDAFQQSFGVTIGEDMTTQASEVGRSSVSSPADVSVDRAAIRSMVEEFWRAFISVAATNPQIGAQTIENFDERIQATASLMVPVNAQIFLQAVEDERDLLFEEYKRNPDALKRRLGLAAVNQSRTNRV